MPRDERRRYQRVLLPHPVKGTVNGVRVYVIDISVIGARVAHQEPLPAPGSACNLRFDTEHGAITLDCEIRRTLEHKKAARPGERSTFHSGLEITAARHGSDDALREFIAYFVSRALDEQKANARGIPATAALSYQTGKGTSYVRHELSGGRWRAQPVKESKQPVLGFTVAESETADNVAMLREAYEAANEEGRRLIRTMAELSISSAEGIPTRRFNP